MPSKRGFDRTARIAELIQHAIAPIVQQEMADDRFNMVTITSVTVSRDLSYAKVYVTVLLDDHQEIKELMQALNRQAKAIRFSLAKAVKLRVMPELRFVYDESTATGFHLSNLIDQAVKKSDKK